MPFHANSSILQPFFEPLLRFSTFVTCILRDCRACRILIIIGAISCLIIFCVLLILLMNFVRGSETRGNVPPRETNASSGGQTPNRRAPSTTSSTMESHSSTRSTQASHPTSQTQPQTIPPRRLTNSFLCRIRTESHTPLRILHGPSLSDSPVTELTTRETQIESSGVDKLPPEIFQMIFQYSASWVVPQSPSPSPYSLRLVSKKWRNIFDGMPKLWLSLHPSLYSSKCTSSILGWYMRVTGDISKRVTTFDHITLRLPDEESLINRYLYEHLLELVEKSTAITVNLPSSLQNTSPRLLDSFSSSSGAPIRRKRSDGPELEHLRKVTWTMSGYPFQQLFPASLNLPWSSLRALPWAQLTHVALCLSMTLHDCVFIFEHANSIEELALGMVSNDREPVLYPGDPKDTLSYLQSLTIVAEVYLSDLLRKYRMPKLRNLSLTLEGDASLDLHQLAVPWPRLTHVTLHCFLSVNVINSIVWELNDVEVLVFKGMITGDGIWSVQKRLPSLKIFTLPDVDAVFADAMMTHFAQHIFSNSLEALDVPSIPLPTPNLFPYPFGSLRTICLSQPVSPSHFLSLLSFAKNLVEGKFRVGDGENESLPSPTSSPPVSPPLSPISDPTFVHTTSKIHSLDLQLYFQRTSGGPFFDALTLPNLVSFTFEASRLSSDCDALLRFVKRSQCPLVKLSLNYQSGDALQLLPLLSSTLEDFSVTNTSVITMGRQSWFGRELLEGLTHGRCESRFSTGCLCPRLERLQIWPCADASLFREMVLSRSNHESDCECKVRKLKHVIAAFGAGDWTTLKQELKDKGIGSDLTSVGTIYPSL